MKGVWIFLGSISWLHIGLGFSSFGVDVWDLADVKVIGISWQDQKTLVGFIDL
jgi:hypothetical protein